MAKPKKTITIDQKLLDEIDRRAKKSERSRSQQIAYFVKLGMKVDPDDKYKYMGNPM